MSDERAPWYVVCDRCGFYVGAMRHLPHQIRCSDCGADAGWAFAKCDKALEYSAQVRAAKDARS